MTHIHHERNGFKDSSVGNIPTEWDVVEIVKIARITTGNKDTQDRDDSAQHPFFVRSQKIERINSYSFDGEAVLTAGDGVGVGKVFHYYVGKFDFHQRVYCLHSFSDDVSGYFFYEFFRHNFMKRVSQFSAKGSVDSVRMAMIAEMPVPKPPKPEQSKIAEILSTVDRAIERTEGLIAKQQRIKTGLMQDLLTRGIDENGNLRSEQTHQFKDSPRGRIPVEWDYVPLGSQLRNIEQGWSPDCDSVPAAQGQWGVLKTTSVVWEGFQFKQNKMLPSSLKPRPQYEVRQGDVLMTRGGPNSRVGVVAFVYKTQPKLILSDKLYRLVFADLVDPEFVISALSSAETQRHLSTLKTGLAESQTNISQEIVRQLHIALPPKPEQEEISKMLRNARKQSQSDRKNLEKLRSLKTALMQDLLTGEVRVTPLLNPEPTALAAGGIPGMRIKTERPDASAFGSHRDCRLFTVGHSNRSDAEFVELLRRYGITAVADVRSQPYSQYLPHFNREPLKELLSASEISYVFMGEELGARRSETECYVDGQAKYELIAETPAFHAGLDRIRTGVSQHVVALMCAEKDPMTCHRAILVARTLRTELDIRHIISAEELESHEELEQRLLRRWNLDGQNLFLTTDELLQEAHEKQAAEIAFVEKELAPVNHEGESDD